MVKSTRAEIHALSFRRGRVGWSSAGDSERTRLTSIAIDESDFWKWQAYVLLTSA